MKDKSSQQKFVRITTPKTKKEMDSILIMGNLANCAISYAICFN